MPYQSAFLAEALAPEADISALSVARGNGKSTFVGAIAASALDGPLAQPRAETVIVASAFSQARIVFEHCLAFLADKLTDKSRWRVQDSSNHAEIEYRPTGARLRALGADPRRLHGLAPALILVDEPAQQNPGQAASIYAALKTAMGKIAGCRMIVFGTRSADPEHYFSHLLNGGADVANCYWAEAGAELTEANIRRANPAWDHFPELRRVILKEAEQAGKDASLRPQFDALRLNAGVLEVGRDHLLEPDTFADLERSAAELPPASGDYVLGFDLSSGAAMSAASACWPESGRCEFVAAFPRLPTLAERGRRDVVGADYERMARDRDLICVGERVVDVDLLLAECINRWGIPGAVVADRWRQSELAQAMAAVAIPLDRLVSRGQGWRDGGQDVSDFRQTAIARAIRVPRSFALRHAIANCHVIGDPAGNWKIAKRSESKRVRRKGRDDIAVALVLAVAEAKRIRRSGPPVYSMAGHGVIA